MPKNSSLILLRDRAPPRLTMKIVSNIVLVAMIFCPYQAISKHPCIDRLSNTDLLFSHDDVNKDRLISRAEFMSAFNHIRSKNGHIDIREAKTAFAYYDLNHDNYISRSEFYEAQVDAPTVSKSRKGCAAVH